MSEFLGIATWIMGEGYLDRLNVICANSYIHPNGFAKVVLPPISSECQEYRFHSWANGFVETDIHNHTAEFSSFVLSGAVYEQTYDEVPGNTYDIFRCTRRTQQGTSNLLFQRKSDLRESERRIVTAGRRYHIGLDTYHQVKVESTAPTATLVRQEIRQRDFSLVARLATTGPRPTEEQLTSSLSECEVVPL